MAELLSAAFAEDLTREKYKNPLATQRGFQQSAKPILRTVTKPGAGDLSQTDPEGSLLPAAVAKGRRWEKPLPACDAQLRNLPDPQ